MSNYPVANTILEQLGGRKFMAMTGVKEFFVAADNVSFRLPGGGGFTKNGVNLVVITLDPSDTYTMRFSRFRAGKTKLLSEHVGVYFDALQEIFTRETGLATRL